MRKIDTFVCDKCHKTFATGAECHKHEEICGKETELVEILLSVNPSEGAIIDSAATIGEYAEDNTIRVCDQADDHGYPIERKITLMDPQVDAVYTDGYNFSVWCTKDQELDAERKLREYAKKVLKDQRSKLDMMLRKLEEV